MIFGFAVLLPFGLLVIWRLKLEAPGSDASFTEMLIVVDSLFEKQRSKKFAVR